MKNKLENQKAKDKQVGRAGFEPATFRLSVERSSRAELPARAFGKTSLILCCFIRIAVNTLMQHHPCVVGLRLGS
jgi:hypothetical protein